MPPRKKAAATVAEANGVQTTAKDLAAAINHRFNGAVVRMGSDKTLDVQRIPTGILPLDYVLDGGVPRGRFIEVYGSYSTLKSYYLYKAMAATQALGGCVGIVDTEHAWDPDWARSLGVKTDDVLVSQPHYAEQGIGAMEVMIREKLDLVGLDSIAASIPLQHYESAPGEDTQPGALARVMSKGLARLNAANSHTAVMCLNQTREKIGVSFGSPTTTSGGKAMGFYASARLSFIRIEKVTESFKQWDGSKYVDAKRVVAHRIKCTLEKSKLSAPYADAIFDFTLKTAEVDNAGWLIGQGLERGLVTNNSGRWDIPGVFEKTIHGQTAFRQYVNDNPEVIEWLRESVLPA